MPGKHPQPGTSILDKRSRCGFLAPQRLVKGGEATSGNAPRPLAPPNAEPLAVL